MLIFTTRFSKKKAALAVILLGLLFAALIFLLGRAPTNEESPQLRLTTSQDCAAYLTSCGWEVLPEPIETLQFLLPDVLEEPYLSYNALQLTQGFDLSDFCGKQVSRITFTVTNYPQHPEGVQANLYLCEEILIAGDILCTGQNGFQVGLTFPEPAPAA